MDKEKQMVRRVFTLEAPRMLEYQSSLPDSLRQGMLGILDVCDSGKTHVSPSPVMLQNT